MMEKTLSRTRLLKIVLPALAAGFAAAASFAGTPLAGEARAAVDKLLRTQTAGLPGKVGIEVEAPGSAALPPCDALEAFLPRGAAAWGRVTIGLRCHSDQKPWTRYVLAHVAVEGRYFVASRNIETGQAFGAGDLVAREGDLTALPRSVITDAAQLEGVVAANRIASGAPLRREQLRGVTVIQQGQTVTVVAGGPGFLVSTEARAMTSAGVGSMVRAKTVDGRLVSGVADEEGQIRLAQ